MRIFGLLLAVKTGGGWRERGTVKTITIHSNKTRLSFVFLSSRAGLIEHVSVILFFSFKVVK